MSVCIASGSPMSREAMQCQVRVRLMSFFFLLPRISFFLLLSDDIQKQKNDDL
jgi:hypothetical protein